MAEITQLSIDMEVVQVTKRKRKKLKFTLCTECGAQALNDMDKCEKHIPTCAAPGCPRIVKAKGGKCDSHPSPGS